MVDNLPSDVWTPLYINTDSIVYKDKMSSVYMYNISCKLLDKEVTRSSLFRMSFRS